MPFCEGEISSTSAPMALVVANVRLKTSGAPLALAIVIIATSLMEVSAFTPSRHGGPDRVIFVPGCSGANVLRIQTGIPRCVTARRVFRCRTLAPKYASSAAS